MSKCPCAFANMSVCVHKACSKSIETESVFMKTEMNMLTFSNSPFHIFFIPESFLLIEASPKLLSTSAVVCFKCPQIFPLLWILSNISVYLSIYLPLYVCACVWFIIPITWFHNRIMRNYVTMVTQGFTRPIVNICGVLYLPSKIWTMNETLSFFKILLLAFKTLIPLSFPLVEALHKLLFLYSVNHWCCMFQLPSAYQNLKLRWIFSFKNKKSHTDKSLCEWRVQLLYNLIVLLNVYSQNLFFFQIIPKASCLCLDSNIDFSSASLLYTLFSCAYIWIDILNFEITNR